MEEVAGEFLLADLSSIDKKLRLLGDRRDPDLRAALLVPPLPPPGAAPSGMATPHPDGGGGGAASLAPWQPGCAKGVYCDPRLVAAPPRPRGRRRAPPHSNSDIRWFRPPMSIRHPSPSSTRKFPANEIVGLLNLEPTNTQKDATNQSPPNKHI